MILERSLPNQEGGARLSGSLPPGIRSNQKNAVPRLIADLAPPSESPPPIRWRGGALFRSRPASSIHDCNSRGTSGAVELAAVASWCFSCSGRSWKHHGAGHGARSWGGIRSDSLQLGIAVAGRFRLCRSLDGTRRDRTALALAAPRVSGRSGGAQRGLRGRWRGPLHGLAEPATE